MSSFFSISLKKLYTCSLNGLCDAVNQVAFMHLRRLTRWTQHQVGEVFVSSRRICCIDLRRWDFFLCQFVLFAEQVYFVDLTIPVYLVDFSITLALQRPHMLLICLHVNLFSTNDSSCSRWIVCVTQTLHLLQVPV